MNERLYQVCADVLVTAVQLTSESSAATSGDLRQRLIGALDRMVSDGRRMGIADGDLAEARYALVAFIDEQIMRSDWAGKAEWMARPLQLELYRENTAGENFFLRLRALLRAGDRPVSVEIYYLCLVLGFQGAYRDGGEPQAVEKFTRAAHDQLRKVLPDPSKVSPHAKPKGSTRSVKTGWTLLLFVAASSLALILIVLVGLGWSASSERDQLVEQLGRRDPRAASTGSSLQERAPSPRASAASPRAGEGASPRAGSASPRAGTEDERPGTTRASVRPVTEP
jgi:type VI secretion system protein ImpK